jgi:hypothetical protein
VAVASNAAAMPPILIGLVRRRAEMFMAFPSKSGEGQMTSWMGRQTTLPQQKRKHP